jgi:hypothetical protein
MKKNTSGSKMKAKLKRLAQRIKISFFDACHALDILPVFREAAGGGESSGGLGYHDKTPIGIPGAKFHAMTGQAEKSADVRRQRANDRANRNRVLGRPDYYSNFEKYNNFKV